MNFEWGDKPIRWPLAFMFYTGILWTAALGLGILLGNGDGALGSMLQFVAFLGLWMLPYVVLRYRDGAWPARAVARLRAAV